MAERITQETVGALVRVDASQRVTAESVEVLLVVDHRQRLTAESVEVLFDSAAVPVGGFTQAVWAG